MTPRELRLALDGKADNERRWRVLQAWLTARLSLSDPKHFPPYESLIAAKTDASQDGIDHELLRRMTELHMGQQAARTAGGGDDDGSR